MAVIVGYFLIGCVAYWPVFPVSNHLFGIGGDFVQSLWFLAWVPHALDNGLNPLYSHAMYVPAGVNLAANTSTPLLGLISAPFARILTPIVRANLLLLIAMPISATAVYVVLRKWRIWAPAAALGGLIYGFSPYMVGQGVAHLPFAFLPLPPLIALTVVSILRGRGHPWRLGIQLALLVTAQYLISQEMFTSVLVLTIVGVACVAVRHPADVPAMLRTAWRPVGIAVGISAVLLAYPAWMTVAGPQHFAGTAFPTTNPYHNDLFSFVVPGPLQKVSLGLRSIGNRLAIQSGAAEADGYIGVPLLILTGAFAWRSRRSPRTQLVLVLLAVSAILTLGPHLAVNGHLTGIPLPFLLLDHIPIVNNLLPSRFSFEMGACLAAVITFGLDDLRRAPAHDHSPRSTRQGRVSVALVGVTLAVAVATLLPEWPLPSVESSATALPSAIRRAFPGGLPVTITYPYATGNTSQALLWQAEDGFGFRLLGGYAYHGLGPNPAPSALFPSVMSPPELQQFLAAQDPPSLYGPTLTLTTGLVASTRTALSDYHVGLVLVDRSASGSGAVMNLFRAALGPPKQSAGRFSLWANWPDSPTRPIYTDLATRVSRPTAGATLSGGAVLDAAATDYLRVTKVNFLLTVASGHSTVIATATPSLVGWIARWNTDTVPNDTYALQSIAYDGTGKSSESAAIRITVHN